MKAVPDGIVRGPECVYLQDRTGGDEEACMGGRGRVPGARAALVGFGGIGKSQLAIRYAHGVRNRSHVFWVNATTRATLEESIRAISERLSLEKPGDSREDIFRRVGNWLQMGRDHSQ